MAGSRVSLRDVASRVGVHPSTASRVLNPATRDMVSPELAQQILTAAQEMGYRPNPFALGLRTKRSFTVGVLIPDLTNPVFPPIIRGLEKALGEAGFTAMLADPHNHGAHERVILEKMKSRWVDGLILATAHREDTMVEQCMQEGIPFVLINRTVDDPTVPHVVNDDALGIRLAVDHMVWLGHRNIAHIAGPQSISTGYERYRGFLDAMAHHGLEPDPDLIVFCETYSEMEGRQALSALLERGKPFTAVICSNDLMALGCYDVLRERAIRCPEDISVMGFNDMPFVGKFNPPMTTVKIPLVEMGERAARLLLELIRDPECQAKPEKVSPTLIVRQSTAPANQHGDGADVVPLPL